MKFIERFGKLLGSTFLFLAIGLEIMCLIAGYTPLQVLDLMNMFFTISLISNGASITATKIMREEREAFKEIMDKAFKVSEVKKDANAKDID
jgi:hypothetical protein